jgi:type IV secretion system protein VirD4
VRTQTPGRRRARRLVLTVVLVALLAGVVSGVLIWLLAQTALLLTLHPPLHLPLSDATRATWRLVLTGRWSAPASAFPLPAQRVALPHATWWLAAIFLLLGMVAVPVGACWRLARSWGSGSPLAYAQPGPRRWLRDTGLIRARTWARPHDLRRLWVRSPTGGRPYLGLIGRAPARMLAAEREVQTLVVAPPRSGKSTGYVIPWLLDHEGPALVLSVKRDIYDATVAYRRSLGRVWVYDPFGDEPTCSFSPLSTAGTWEGALRAATALSSAAQPDQVNAASEFWDREASVLLAPLLHVAKLTDQTIATVLDWLDRRDFARAERQLEDIGAHAAAAQLRGVLARDPRNRETTVMSAANLLRAYRYPRVTRTATDELTPSAFFSGTANTIYVVAAAHHQRDLQPVILALVSAIYETAIEASRHNGPFKPELYLLLDEAANIAPVRDLAPWLSQCGDHGITIATSWQSIAQIDYRYGKAERDAILAASTAQVFLPPLADPTTTGYITSLLGEEPVTHATHSRHGHSGETLAVNEQSVASAPWLRQIARGHALLVYRDLPPAVIRAPGWYEDQRFDSYREFVESSTARRQD